MSIRAAKKPFEVLGQAILDLVEELGTMVLLFFDIIRWLFRPPFRIRLILEAMEFVGVGSLFIVLLTGTFTGLVMSIQSIKAFQLFNAETLVGATVALALSRELSPVLTSLMVTGRAGSAMATELGTMRVTEQIDAMVSMAVNPVQYLIVPRVIATTIMMPLLTMLFNFVGIAAAYFMSVYGLGIDPGAFLSKIELWMMPADLINGVVKAAVFGLAISFIGCYKGYTASGGAKGVGEATTAAVVMGSVTTLVLDYFLTVMMW